MSSRTPRIVVLWHDPICINARVLPQSCVKTRQAQLLTYRFAITAILDFKVAGVI
jgi:hypothetical protein